jgi:hypothetical protein
MGRFFKKGNDRSPEEQKVYELLDPKTPGSLRMFIDSIGAPIVSCSVKTRCHNLTTHPKNRTLYLITKATLLFTLQGMHTGVMKEVCALTHNREMRQMVLSAVCGALQNKCQISTDDAKTANKALLLFEYILLNGFEGTVGELLDRISFIQDMKTYNNHEVSKYEYGRDVDKGASVRKKVHLGINEHFVFC